jgi:predicted acyl esterase
VAGAGFNGTHRESARKPKDIEPGVAFPLEIEMHFTSWVFPRGHRVRLAISNAQWPMMWPTPYPMTTTLHLGGTRVLLPVVPFEERPGPQFLPPAEDPTLPGFERLDDGTPSGYGEVSSIHRNPQTGAARVVLTNRGDERYPWGTERFRETITHETNDRNPAETSMRGSHRMVVELEGRTLVWEGELLFRSDLENFYYTYTRRLLENGALVREKTWTDIFPRDYQ